MSESNREHLSALMDGEIDAKGRDFLLRRLSGDPEMSRTWQRYHLVRSCLHQEMASGMSIADRVAEALDDEPALVAESRGGWFKPIAGTAIAASVALMAIVGINSNLMERGTAAPEIEQPGFVSQPTAFDQPFSRQATPVSFSDSLPPADRERINNLVVRHNQAVGAGGFVAYLPIVTAAPVEAASDPEAQDDHEED